MEILAGTNSPIQHRVFWKGESAVADSIPTVSLLRADVPAQTVLYSGTAVQSETDTGVYNFYAPQTTKLPGSLIARWQYAVEGFSISYDQNVDVVKPYVDLSQVINGLGLGSDYNDPNSRTYQELVDAEKYSRKVIENYTQQKFYSYLSSEIAYGSGNDILPLSNKINTLQTIEVNDIPLTGMPFEVAESGFSIRLNRADMLDNVTYVANGLIPPTINDYSGIFNKDARYKITGYFGWEKVPSEVEMAAIELMKDYFSKDKVWRNKYIKSISTFDWQFDFNSATFSGTGNNYVDQLLLPYVISKMVLI
jgi:hypothetical protein